MQLGAAEARVFLAVSTGRVKNDGFGRVVPEVVIASLVESLSAITKQPAESFQGRAREPSA